jgi:hypothetical protein
MRFLHHAAALAIIATTSTAYAEETEAQSRMKSGGMVVVSR